MNKINSCDNIQAGYDYPELSKYRQPKLQTIHINGLSPDFQKDLDEALKKEGKK